MRRRVAGWITDAADAVDRDELTVATFNIWFDASTPKQRYRAIADLLSRAHDRMSIVLQEVTPAHSDVFLGQPWIRDD